ncbi:MAG: cation transporter [Terriglobales bacterium]
MRLSLIVGLAMLIVKTTVYFMTHSTAIFSDAAESVVHVIAVGFAAFSLQLSAKSASPQFLYGYERITFFSAGFEGAMIIVAAVAIFIEAIRKWVAGLQLEHSEQVRCWSWQRESSTRALATTSCGRAGGLIH